MPHRIYFAENLAAIGNIVVSAIMCFISAQVAAFAAQIGPDIVAAVGAAVAGFIASVEAQRRQRDFWQTTCVFVASIAVGWMAPGAMVWYFLPDHFTTMPWQAWAGLGFIFGLLGWAITAGILALRNRIPGVISELANKVIPVKTNNEKTE